jgi:hypothetical protein
MRGPCVPTTIHHEASNERYVHNINTSGASKGYAQHKHEEHKNDRKDERIQSPPPQSKKRFCCRGLLLRYAPGDCPPGLPIKGDCMGPPCWLGGPPGMHSMRFPWMAMDNWGERAAPRASIRYAMICTFNCCSCGGEKLCGGWLGGLLPSFGPPGPGP